MMRLNEKFPNSFLSSADNPAGLFSLCVFNPSVISLYSEDFQNFINDKFNLDRLSFVLFGDRIITKWFKNIDLSITGNAEKIAAVVTALFRNEWERLYISLVKSTYNPTENYNMEEHEEYNGSEDKTGYDESELTHGETATTTHGHNVGLTANDKTATIDKEETTASSNDQTNIFGFNSSGANGVPADKRTGSGSSTVETTKNDDHTSTETHSGTDSIAHTGKDSTKDTYNSGIDKDYERDLTRHGNIGVTTNQQMLESEIELRKQRLIDIILSDVINFFTIPIY